MNMNMNMNNLIDFFILIMGAISYLYLLFKLHTQKNINFIILYFTTLVVGYLIVGKYIFLLNIIFIIYDVFFGNVIEQYSAKSDKDDKKFDEDWDNGMAHSTNNAEETGTELTKEEDLNINTDESESSESATNGNTVIERQKKDEDFDNVKEPTNDTQDFFNN
jgi:hypothetical protein